MCNQLRLFPFAIAYPARTPLRSVIFIGVSESGSFLAVYFREHFLGDMEGGVRGGDAAANCALQQHFPNFVARHFVIQRGSYVHPEFIAAIERNHHRERYQAARISRKSRPRPDFSPGVARDEILERLVEGGFVLLRSFDMHIAKHRATNFHSRFVSFAITHIFSGHYFPSGSVRKLNSAFVNSTGASTLERCDASSSTSFAPGIVSTRQRRSAAEI